jgi:hypothetical protein
MPGMYLHPAEVSRLARLGGRVEVADRHGDLVALITGPERRQPRPSPIHADSQAEADVEALPAASSQLAASTAPDGVTDSRR